MKITRKFKRRDILALSALLGMAVLAAGCGASASIPQVGGIGGINPPLYGTVGCTTGQPQIAGLCTYGTTYQEQCTNLRYYNSGITTSTAYTSGSTPACRIVAQLPMTASVLNPNSGYSGTVTASVKTYDKVRLVTTSSPYWGHNGSCSGSVFQFCTQGSCTADEYYNTTAVNSDNNMTQGLWASVSGENFQLKTTAYAITSAGGQLYTGFNVPQADQSQFLCAGGNAKLEITRCEAQGGTSVQCP